jgi:hypothetical protein
VIRSNNGRAMSNENRGSICRESNRAMARSIKNSVRRVTIGLRGHRHVYKYHASSSMGIIEKASGESIAATTKTTATYILDRNNTLRLLSLIISLI